MVAIDTGTDPHPRGDQAGTVGNVLLETSCAMKVSSVTSFRHVFLPFLTFVSASVAIAQVDTPMLSLTPFVSFEKFNSTTNLGTSFAFGIGASYALSRTVSLDVAVRTGNASEQIDLIGTTSTQTVHHTTYQVQVQYLTLAIPQIADAYATAGVGLFRLSTDEQQVSLGALGQLTVPARGETQTVYSIGMMFSRLFSPRVGFRLQPQMFLRSPLSDHEFTYMISGGITLVVF